MLLMFGGVINPMSTLCMGCVGLYSWSLFDKDEHSHIHICIYIYRLWFCMFPCSNTNKNFQRSRDMFLVCIDAHMEPSTMATYNVMWSNGPQQKHFFCKNVCPSVFVALLMAHCGASRRIGSCKYVNIYLFMCILYTWVFYMYILCIHVNVCLRLYTITFNICMWYICKLHCKNYILE